MCFSAQASIASGALLIPAGIYCVFTASRKSLAYLPLAVTPLIFGFQQFCEGAVWIGLQRDDPDLVKPASLGFLFVAVAFWPFWVNAIAVAMEPSGSRRNFFAALATISLVLGGACYIPAATHYGDWLRVGIEGDSIRYDLTRVPVVQSAAGVLWRALYLTLISVAPVMARDRSLQLLGMSVGAAAVFTHFAYRYAFVSVWCFFAAILSIQICHIVYKLPERASARIS